MVEEQPVNKNQVSNGFLSWISALHWDSGVALAEKGHFWSSWKEEAFELGKREVFRGDAVQVYKMSVSNTKQSPGTLRSLWGWRSAEQYTQVGSGQRACGQLQNEGPLLSVSWTGWFTARAIVRSTFGWPPLSGAITVCLPAFGQNAKDPHSHHLRIVSAKTYVTTSVWPTWCSPHGCHTQPTFWWACLLVRLRTLGAAGQMAKPRVLDEVLWDRTSWLPAH